MDDGNAVVKKALLEQVWPHMTERMKNKKLARISPVLVGLMGSGKSSIGRRLAEYLDVPLLDLDEMIIERAGCSIPEIFARLGEEAFRDMETATLGDALGRHAVIATGGGVVMRAENMALLKEHPPVIWLKASPEFLAQRIDGDLNRPLIAAGDTLNKLKELARVRYPLYEECADFILPRGDMEKSEALAEIVAFLNAWQKRVGNPGRKD
ncbi:MAG TPA: shikimate kinase [Mariprofundaceae bacterium]|nr:shikimate kinase [Mariprofundaceae bacterium]